MNAETYYGNKANLKTYVKNLYGWETANTRILITFAYDSSTNSFLVDHRHSFVIFDTWAAWLWYSNLKWAEASVDSGYIYGLSVWEMGSPLVSIDGIHKLSVATTVTPKEIRIYYYVHWRSNYKWDVLLRMIPVAIQIAKQVG